MKIVSDKNLMAAMARCLSQSHWDENQGVPIGARSMAFAVLACFEDGDEAAKILGLGPAHQLPTEWAAEHNKSFARARQGDTK